MSRRLNLRYDPRQFFDRNSDDDDDDNDDRKSHTTNISMIDLTISPTKPIVENKKPDYTPYTLRSSDDRRLTILPAFPTSIYNEQPDLLLVNVSNMKLSDEQKLRRHPNTYPIPYAFHNNSIPSYFRDQYQTFISPLISQFKIDESIIDYNLYRFTQCLNTLAKYYIHHHQYTSDEFEFTDKQKLYAFEFFLQIDVDLFYMKTCSYRGATPLASDQSLFSIEEPQARYNLTACNRCPLCQPRYIDRSRPGPAIYFKNNSKHVFVSGYEAILNCPATCTTKNIIYTLTCACDEFDYIGETGLHLNDRLRYHRQHINRIMHEFLIGEENVAAERKGHKDQETLVKDGMQLYRHAARCTKSMQRFLNYNSIYTCFVPIPKDEVEQYDRCYTLPSTVRRWDTVYPTSIASIDRSYASGNSQTRTDELARAFMRRLPSLPNGYTFSIEQRVRQFLYFKEKSDINIKPHPQFDLFDVSIVAVLPEDACSGVRRFVEALFITHTQTRLNTSGRLVFDPMRDEIKDTYPDEIGMSQSDRKLYDRGEWFLNLDLPFQKLN